MTRFFCAPPPPPKNKKQIRDKEEEEEEEEDLFEPYDGSRVTSISAPLPFFSFLMMIFGAMLFFSSPLAASPLLLSSCLAWSALPQPFHTSVPQLARVLPAPAVNYSSPTRVLTAQKCASFDRRGPSLFFLRVFFFCFFVPLRSRWAHTTAEDPPSPSLPA